MPADRACAPTVRALDPSDRAVAERIHAIQQAAYAQEAALLGATWFPPLGRTVTDLQASPEEFLGAFRDGVLAGVVGLEPGESPAVLHIASLVVAPEHQRRGVGRELVSAVIERGGHAAVTVSTGAANLPALTLYAQLGFVEERRSTVGPEALPVVLLRWARAPRAAR